MTSPPAFSAPPDEPAVCITPDAHLAFLIREARALDPALRDVGKARLLRMAREFAVARELDLRDREARRAASDEFGAWLRRRGDLIQPRSKRKFRVGEPGWRTRT
ncbi:hypothetical protein [Nocardioides sp. BYT-33-1]|uniref:hypothetical protein n=1 Tax=Nocardioides sp. BYT-33-1 TaxID=3416952 RepID=UPI003F530D4A